MQPPRRFIQASKPPIKARPTTPPTTEPAMTPVLLLPPSPSPTGVSDEEATGADEDEAVEEGLALVEGVLEVR